MKPLTLTVLSGLGISAWLSTTATGPLGVLAWWVAMVTTVTSLVACAMVRISRM